MLLCQIASRVNSRPANAPAELAFFVVSRLISLRLKYALAPLREKSPREKYFSRKGSRVSKGALGILRNY
jgi:hypothetical protein